MPHGSLAQFKATLARKKERTIKQERKFDKGSIAYKNTNDKPEYHFPKPSKAELEKIKGEIRNKLKKEEKRVTLKVIFVLVLISILILVLT